MKKYTIAVLTAVFVLTGIQTFAHADSHGGYSWSDKMGRGLVNTVTSPLELVMHIKKVTNEHDVPTGVTVGFFEGAAYTAVRAVTGVTDFLTGPFNWPTADKGPMVSPEYAWQMKS